MTERTCKDCETAGRPLTRPAPHPGPRCTTDHRAVTKTRKRAAAERRDARVYGLAAGGYDELKRIQGGTCAICPRATGKTRRLCVDHDHANGHVRGLLCKTCNSMLGHARDDVEFFRRAMAYLYHPPALDLHPAYLIEEHE